MSQFVPASNVVQAELRMVSNGEPIENTLYFERAAPWDIITMDALGAALQTWWGAGLATQLCNTLSLNEIYLTDLTTQTSLAITHPVTPPIVGSMPDAPCSNNVAFCISFRTSNRGRSARGRNYIGGLTETIVNGNLVSSTFANNVRGIYSQLIALAAGQDCTWIVCSRWQNKVPRPQAVRYLIREVVYTNLVVDTQRRRLPK